MCENGEDILFLVFDGIMENCTHVCRIVCSVCTYMYVYNRTLYTYNTSRHVGASLSYLGCSNEAIVHSQTNLVFNHKVCA